MKHEREQTEWYVKSPKGIFCADELLLVRDGDTCRFGFARLFLEVVCASGGRIFLCLLDALLGPEGIHFFKTICEETEAPSSSLPD